MENNKIEIKCQGAIEVDPFEIEEFQGELKTLTTTRYEQLKKSILTLGFSFPEIIWKNPENNKWTVLDGTQRIRTIKRMVSKEGFECPKLPCSIVEAIDKKQAKMKLLAAASQYGSVDKEGLYEFMQEGGISMSELAENFNFPEIDMPSFELEFFHDKAEDFESEEESISDKDSGPIECPQCGHLF